MSISMCNKNKDRKRHISSTSDSKKASGVRAVKRCNFLRYSPFSDTEGALFRSYLSPACNMTIQQISQWMKEAGMTIRRDAAGNIIGRYEGIKPNAPALLIGSHLDTVRNAGCYDGTLGVVLGIEAVSTLALQQKRFPFAIEVIGFGDEEGSRFSIPMLTSRAVAGTLKALPSLTDADGVPLDQALYHNGLDPHRFLEAAYNPKDVIGYIEAHIEQGPILEYENNSVGLVTSVAAQYRFYVTLTGNAGHAGTMPMHLRQDALAAAAEAISKIEEIAKTGSDDLVATVGQITVGPNASNVVPGSVQFSIDVRGGTNTVRDTAASLIQEHLHRITKNRNIAIDISLQYEVSATLCDKNFSNFLESSIKTVTKKEACKLVSGAGHDAMIIKSLAPVCMLFIRCDKGVSHNPAEAVKEQDVEIALQVMTDFIQNLSFGVENMLKEQTA